MVSTSAKRREILEGYFASVSEKAGRKKYLDKIGVHDGVDSYKISRPEWMDDVL